MNNMVKALVAAALLAGVFLVVLNMQSGDNEVVVEQDQPLVEDNASETEVEGPEVKSVERVLVKATGSVKSKGGDAISGAKVVVYALQDGRSEVVRQAQTDSDGKFEISAIAVGNYRFSASKSSYQTARVEKVLAEGSDNRVDFVLERGLTISGRVTDLSGSGIENAEIRAFKERAPKDADITKRLMILTEAQDIQEDVGVRAYTDDSGLYEVSGLEPGEYRMMALAENFAPGRKEYVAVGSSNVDFALDAGGILSGTVQTTTLKPIQGTLVQVYPMANTEDLVETVLLHLRPALAEVETNGAGYYEFRQLGGDDEYRVRFSAPAFQAVEFEKVVVTSASEPLDVQLSDGHVISGVVYDPDGNPLEGANIKANEQGAARGNPTSALGDKGVQTDENGRFTLDTLQADMKYRIVAAHQDFATWAQSHIEPSANEELEIHLETGGAVQGRVVDAVDGTGILGAVVTVRDQGGDKTAVTDESGVFYVRGITVGRRKSAHFSFKAEGYTTRSNEKIPVKNDQITEGQEIALDRNGSAAGTIVDAAGTAIPGVSVTVKRQHSPSVPVVVNVSSTVVSDANGYFFIPDVRSGETCFLVGEHPDFLESSGDPFEMPPGTEVGDLVLVMNLGGSLTGRIVDVNTGQPISRATVGVTDDALLEMDPGSLPKNARTDKDGQFVIGSLSPGAHTLIVKADTYLTYEQNGVIVEESFDTPIGEIALKPSSYVAGFVYDTSGNTISGAKIVVKDSADGFRKVNGRSRSDGSFRIDDLGEYPVDIDVTAKGYTKTSVQEIPVNNDNVELTLERLGTVAGVVVDAAQNPILSFAVSPKLSKKGRFVSPVPSKTFQRREDGSFRFPNLPPGSYEIGIGAPGYSFEKVYNVLVQPDGTTDIGVIVLEEGSKIAGFVVDQETGNPIQRAMITVVGGKKSLVGMDKDNPSRRARGQGSALSGSDGYFEISGVASRNITLKVQSAGYVDERVRVRGGNQEVTIEMSAGGGITGIIYDGDGDPVEGVGVYLTGGKHDRGVTDREGRYQFRNLPVGNYQIRAANLLGEEAKYLDRKMRSGALGQEAEREAREQERRAKEDAELDQMDPEEREALMRERAEQDRKRGKRNKTSGLAAMKNAKSHRVNVRAGDITVQDIYLDVKK